MDVTELFDALLFGSNVEIVIARLPNVVFIACFGEALFENLDCDGKWFLFGLSDKEMHVIGHDDVAENVKCVEFARALEQFAEDVAGCVCAKERLVPDATEGDEMRELRLLVAIQAR